MAIKTILITAKRNQALSTAIINRGPSGPNVIESAEDIASVELPNLNNPLSQALAGKAASSHTHQVADLSNATTAAKKLLRGEALDAAEATALRDLLVAAAASHEHVLANITDAGSAAGVEADQNLRTADAAVFEHVRSQSPTDSMRWSAIENNHGATQSGQITSGGKRIVNFRGNSGMFGDGYVNITPPIFGIGNFFTNDVKVWLWANDTILEVIDGNQEPITVRVGAIDSAGGITFGESTVATLPDPTASARQRWEVTDADSPAVGSPVSGGGTDRATVRSDGTNWIVIELL